LSRPGWKPVHFSLDENSRTQIIILPEDENHSPEQTFFISLLTLPPVHLFSLNLMDKSRYGNYGIIS
jgi:hypothetical protein